MIQRKSVLLLCLLLPAFAGCQTSSADSLASPAASESAADSAAAAAPEQSETVPVRITVGDTVLQAEFERNATSEAILEQMPMTLPMENLYGREMCYRYGPDALPTENLRNDGYQVGDIAYWPPRGSFVILYAQNGEEFERQQLGHIDKGVEVFASMSDANVTFEVMDAPDD